MDKDEECYAIAYDCSWNGIGPHCASAKTLESPPRLDAGSISPADDSTIHSNDDVDSDGASDQMKRVFEFIHEVAAGMDEFSRRMDKFEGVLDHLEIDGVQQTEEMRELKVFLGQGDPSVCEWKHLCDRVVQCEREQQLLAEALERRQSEIMLAAAADVEKACQESLQRVLSESLQKECEDAFQRLKFDLSEVANEVEDRRPSKPPPRMQPRAAFPCWIQQPLPAGPRGVGKSACSARSIHQPCTSCDIDDLHSTSLADELGTEKKPDSMPNVPKEPSCSTVAGDDSDQLYESPCVSTSSDVFRRAVSL